MSADILFECLYNISGLVKNLIYIIPLVVFGMKDLKDYILVCSKLSIRSRMVDSARSNPNQVSPPRSKVQLNAKSLGAEAARDEDLRSRCLCDAQRG